MSSKSTSQPFAKADNTAGDAGDQQKTDFVNHFSGSLQMVIPNSPLPLITDLAEKCYAVFLLENSGGDFDFSCKESQELQQASQALFATTGKPEDRYWAYIELLNTFYEMTCEIVIAVNLNSGNPRAARSSQVNPFHMKMH